MILKGIVEDDFINYKEPSMFLAFPYCTFKCEKECGISCCQNSELATSTEIDISVDDIVQRYLQNSITTSIVFGGLEPLDSLMDVVSLIEELRNHTRDPIVIYTGYNEDEVRDEIVSLKKYENIIMKFGRFIPGDIAVYDDVLGIKLASQNQYAIKIS